jgi:hypothetical protein
MLKHGENRRGKRSKEYQTWINMRQRCNDPNHISYKRYGGRGIKVCGKWQNNFEQFLKDVGRAPSPEMSLDRIKNSKGYEPGNVK